MKIELTCFLYNKKMADLDVKVPDIPARITIDPREIESVRERGQDDADEICPKTCMINMRSGDGYQVDKTYDEMIKIWNSYRQ